MGVGMVWRTDSACLLSCLPRVRPSEMRPLLWLTGQMTTMEKNCTLLLHYDKSTPPNEEEIREQLESKDVEQKQEGMKSLISLQVSWLAEPSLADPSPR